jgi:signal transduction histidine kinase
MLDRIHTPISGMREITDNIAHDVRSQLARIRMFAEMTLFSIMTDEAYRAFAADTIEACDQLIQMSNTTLDVAEVEACAARLGMESVNLSRVAEDT